MLRERLLEEILKENGYTFVAFRKNQRQVWAQLIATDDDSLIVEFQRDSILSRCVD